MNIDYFKKSWIKFYKRGFMMGFFVLTFILTVDQFLQTPLFFSKITDIKVFMFIISTIFFAAVFLWSFSSDFFITNYDRYQKIIII